MISSRDNPENHPIYVVDTYLGSVILYNDYLLNKYINKRYKFIKRKEIININK